MGHLHRMPHARRFGRHLPDVPMHREDAIVRNDEPTRLRMIELDQDAFAERASAVSDEPFDDDLVLARLHLRRIEEHSHEIAHPQRKIMIEDQSLAIDHFRLEAAAFDLYRLPRGQCVRQ